MSVTIKANRQLLSIKSRQALKSLCKELKRIRKQAESVNSDTQVMVVGAKLNRFEQEIYQLYQEVAEFRLKWDPAAG